jgi:hypothetical protein
LKIVAVRMRRLGETASAGLLHPHGVVGEHAEKFNRTRTWQLAFSTAPIEIKRMTRISPRTNC